MRLTRRLLAAATLVGLALAGGSLAIVAAQTPETPPAEAPPSTPPPEEAPSATVETPPDVAMQPIPNGTGPLRPPPRMGSSGGGTGEEVVRFELPPLRIIEPGEPIPPPPRTRAPFAILQALDKVTAQTVRFAAPVGQPVRYQNLIITVRACEATTQETSQPEAAAYLEVHSQPRARAGYPAPPSRQVFRGWMFASSPALHPLEHPVYDAWVIACSMSAPTA